MVDKAILSEYDTIVCVDRSGSMASRTPRFPSRWKEAQEITLGLANLASEVDDDGITVVAFGGTFKPARDVVDNVTTSAVETLFSQNDPAGSTPLSDALDAAFKKHFASTKKSIVFVVTDGVPDDPKAVQESIKNAASKLTDASEIRVLFVQVGDDAAAGKYLDDLDNHLSGAKFDIVNAIGFADANGLTPNELFERAISDSH